MADDLVDPARFNTYGQGYRDGAVDRADGVVPDAERQPKPNARYRAGYDDGYNRRAPSDAEPQP
jgi:hypothetical protein